MNLLTYKNRFTNPNPSVKEISEGNGYVLALADLLKYLEEKTEFNPEKRMINALDLAETIQETNEAIAEIWKRVKDNISTANLSSDKVTAFLNEPNDLPDHLFESSPVAWDEGMK